MKIMKMMDLRRSSEDVQEEAGSEVLELEEEEAATVGWELLLASVTKKREV